MDGLNIKNIKELVEVLKTLANLERLKIIALLTERPMYVSEIARKLKLPYPLVHMYLNKLERMGFISSHYEFIKSDKPHVRRYCVLKDFSITISPNLIKQLIKKGERND